MSSLPPSPLPAKPASAADVRRAGRIIYDHCGITLGEGKADMVRARINRLLRDGRYPSATALLDAVEADPQGQTLTELTDALSTNLTSFFREPAHLTHLVNTALPTVPNGRPVRGWCAACSSGEEAYSLGMSLAQTGRPWLLLATDISTRVLRRAAEGRYDATRTGQVPAALRRHLEPDGPGKVRLSREVRAAIRFRYLNLMRELPFAGPFDFIFVRNVMIYFDKPTQAALIARLKAVLRPGGWLYTGHSESLTGVDHGMQLCGTSVYRVPEQPATQAIGRAA